MWRINEILGGIKAIGLIESGADCLILECTEVGILLNQSNVRAPSL